MEPPDTPDRPVSCTNPIITNTANDSNEEDLRHPSVVPAAGRGNSDDGSSWINPSANQLLNACKRKNKPMEDKDKNAVALIHGEVIEKTWEAVLAYERLHYHQCKCPKLLSFEGLSEKPSLKAKLLNKMGYALPWDRHDWIVDRCGTQIRYIIDYHHGFAQSQPYIIDCRPDLKRFSNMMDRFTIQYRTFKYKHFHKTAPQEASTPNAAGHSHQFLTDLIQTKESKET